MKRSALKVSSLLLCLVMIFMLGGCSEETVLVDEIPSEIPVSSEPEPQFAVNPLTGIENLDPAAENKRPVAIMVNNIKPAQSVQTGLDKADIVYEAYAEGGITRLLAVYKDISTASNIGTVRSARYSYIDLAMGHDAVYIHAGINDSHATPHVKETGIDNINLLHGSYDQYSFREKNGKSYEHTLYTSGEKISKGLKELKWRTELKNNKGLWQNFVAEGEEVTPATDKKGGQCESIKVTMSNSYISRFDYDSATKTYKKFSGSDKHKDYKSGKQLSFKNVLVLKTAVTPLSKDGYIVKTGLTGGTGYYVTNGGCYNIKWSKGSASNPIKITMADGSVCNYNQGNTWVCLVNKNNSVKITNPTPKTSSVPAKTNSGAK